MDEIHSKDGRQGKPSSAPPVGRQQHWLNLWSYGRITLKLSDADFYRLTPKQLQSLREEHERREVPLEFMLAQLTAVVVNYSNRAVETPSQPREWMPTMVRRKVTEPKQKRKRSRAVIAAEAAAVLSKFF